jgi:hypothetical protein
MIAVRKRSFSSQQALYDGLLSLERAKFSMSRNGPHTSTKKLSLWKTSTKIFFHFEIQNAKKKVCQVATL